MTLQAKSASISWCMGWRVSDQHAEENFDSWGDWFVNTGSCSVWLSNQGTQPSSGSFEMPSHWRTGRSPLCIHRPSIRSIIIPQLGNRVIDTYTFPPTCHYIESRGQIPPHHVAFMSPSSQTWKACPTKLIPIVYRLADLRIDLCDPSRALPTDSPDGWSFHLSLGGRILSCISEDKRALITKGKAQRNRSFFFPPKQTSRRSRGVGAAVFNLNLCQC